MSKTLAVISVISLTLCVVFFGLARMIGGAEIFHDPKSLVGVKPLIDLATHKEWRWDGGDSLALDGSVDVHYQAGGPPRVTVTGDPDLLSHVQVSRGRIVSDRKEKNKRKNGKEDRLNAVISGVVLKNFSVNGLDRLDLGEIHQDELFVRVSGEGSVTGTGKVGHLELAISGAGKADLGALEVDTANITVQGVGRALIAPKVDLNVHISGAGRVTLASKPQRIEQTISGVGRLETQAGERVQPVMPPSFAPQPPTPPSPRPGPTPTPPPTP